MPKVPSSKPRIQCYISRELRTALERIAESNNETLSEMAAGALETFADPRSIVITLDDESVEKLKKVAKLNYRPLRDQTRMIIMEWLRQEEMGLNE